MSSNIIIIGNVFLPNGLLASVMLNSSSGISPNFADNQCNDGHNQENGDNYTNSDGTNCEWCYFNDAPVSSILQDQHHTSIMILNLSSRRIGRGCGINFIISSVKEPPICKLGEKVISQVKFFCS